MFLRAFGLFLTVIRLSLGQLWAILDRTAPPTHVTHCACTISTRGLLGAS